VVREGGEAALWRRALVVGLVAATLASGLIGIEISKATDTTASWWPAAGVGVVTLFVSPRSWWPRLVVALYLANLLGNVLGGQQWDASACLALADILETVLVGWTCRRLIGRHLTALADLGRLILVSLVGAVVAGLGVALTSRVLLDGEFGRTLVATAGSHWASVIVVAPLGLLSQHAVRRPDTVPIVLHALLLTVVTVFAFGPGTDLALGFLPLPLLIWAGVAYGSRVVVVEQVLMAGVITWLTVGGYGPFATPDHPARTVTSNLITQL
jgi:integral membrane sensor domain MASE1